MGDRQIWHHLAASIGVRGVIDMTFLDLAKSRYSVRNFNSKPVEPDKLTQVLEAGRIAPTACNNQPQRVKVITASRHVKRMKAFPKQTARFNRCDPFYYNAINVSMYLEKPQPQPSANRFFLRLYDLPRFRSFKIESAHLRMMFRFCAAVLSSV